MFNRSFVEPQAGYSQLDHEIEQLQRLLGIWEAQAEIHRGTPFGLHIDAIVDDYVSKLDDLRRTRERAAEF